MSRSVKAVCAIGIFALIGFGSGCAPTSADGVRGNFSPELHSTSRSFEQHRNMEARSIDMNGRMLWEDGARVLLLDRPSRLKPHPNP